MSSCTKRIRFHDFPAPRHAQLDIIRLATSAATLDNSPAVLGGIILGERKSTANNFDCVIRRKFILCFLRYVSLWVIRFEAIWFPVGRYGDWNQSAARYNRAVPVAVVR